MVVLSKKRRTFEDSNIEEDEDHNLDALEPNLESESDEEEEDVKLSEPAKNAVYDKDGMLDKLADINWPGDVEWIQKLTIDIEHQEEVDVNNDFAHETTFYTQALEGTTQAFDKRQSMGLPFLRPPDYYYAEMVKSDVHMEKIKSSLLYKKKQMEEVEETRKASEAKRIAMEVHGEKLKERAKQKKEQIESVKKWRKQRQQNGFAGNDKDLPLPFEDGGGFERPGKKKLGAAPGDRSGGKRTQFAKGNKGMDKKSAIL